MNILLTSTKGSPTTTPGVGYHARKLGTFHSCASVLVEWSHFDDKNLKGEAKRMIVEMVLLAGAKLDSGIGAYAGLDASEG
ncbi:hypothetical protein TL16_g02902 [Triparma laevis f. inornata]|uniref:Uncharacterized protein n=1 Tax=Triparma laevis f. inornata TaxID=1714386 RepID=A0A9W7A0G2_9STRA|nr:hypothetical protein TL16_g02902 [Triparma laevis f. inornata]